MKTNKLMKWAACGASLMMTVTVSVWAGDYYWGAADGSWDGVSWSDSQAGGSLSAKTTTNADNIYFFTDDILSATATLAGSKALNSLFLNKTGYHLTGGTLDFTGAASGTMTVNASGTIGSALTNFKSISFNTAGQTLTLNGGWTTTSNDSLDSLVTASGAAKSTSTLILNSGTFTQNGTGGIRNGYSLGDMNNPTTGGIILRNNARIDVNGNKLFVVNGNGVFRMEGGSLNFNEANQTFNALTVGWSSAGRFIMTGGTIQQNPNTYQNANAGTGIILGSSVNGTFDMQGGVINAKSFSIVSQQGNAIVCSLNISGGTTTVRGIGFGADIGGGWLSGASTNGTANMNLSGGVLNIGAAGLISKGYDNFKYNIILSGGTIGSTTAWNSALDMTIAKTATTSGITFDTTGGNITLNGALTGTGGLTVRGGGTLILGGAASYTGQTVVDTGGVLINSTGSLTVSLADLVGSAVDINSGALFYGLGALSFDTTGVDLGSGGQWSIFSGDLSSLTLTTVSGFTQNGDVWTNGDWSLNQLTGILTYTTIPEPSTFALLAVGAALMVSARLLRKRQ